MAGAVQEPPELAIMHLEPSFCTPEPSGILGSEIPSTVVHILNHQMVRFGIQIELRVFSPSSLQAPPAEVRYAHSRGLVYTDHNAHR